MKSLTSIYIILIVVIVSSLTYINRVVNDLVTENEQSQLSQSQTAYTASKLVVSGNYNSSSDVLQTVNGINIYQESNVNLQ